MLEELEFRFAAETTESTTTPHLLLTTESTATQTHMEGICRYPDETRMSAAFAAPPGGHLPRASRPSTSPLNAPPRAPHDAAAPSPGALNSPPGGGVMHTSGHLGSGCRTGAGAGAGGGPSYRAGPGPAPVVGDHALGVRSPTAM